MIKLYNITKSFGSLQVLKGINLQINKGEVVSIVGPSGAGKTTLLQIMGTLDNANTGNIYIDGTDITMLSDKELARFRNRHIGFVFQFHQLLPEFTALENVMIPGMIAGTSNKELKARAKDLLEYLGLADRADHKPSELSGGEKQRVAVARALINNPAVILADEPSGSLDSKNKTELHQLFFDLRDKFGQTFVIVTHDESLAEMTDRCIHIKDGIIENEKEDNDEVSDNDNGENNEDNGEVLSNDNKENNEDNDEALSNDNKENIEDNTEDNNNINDITDGTETTTWQTQPTESSENS